ncbi:MAG: hypothetical protein NZ585_05400 [Chloracidobacterium sp.]|nr:hypothetical protein [Chloracidobacterium sp.]MDW8217646.1 hypothetical protein [Acidobacteriota bacterium]
MNTRARFFLFQHRKLVWRRRFGCFFLAWLFLDLCVVHMLNPQYAAAELFGCVVPAVVALPSDATAPTPGWTAVPTGLETAERLLPVHSCFWNTQSLLDAPTVALPPQCFVLSSAARPTVRLVWYARLFLKSIFHPPRLA